MKRAFKILFLLLSQLLILNQKAKCQAIIGLEVGYGFPWAVDDVPDGNIKFADNGSKEIETFKYSNGTGMNYSLFFKYSINSLIESKCLVSYLDGTFATKTIQFSTTSTNESYKGNMFWIAPNLIFNLNKKKISPYAFVGFMVGVAGKITKNGETRSTNKLTETKVVYSHGTAFGLSSGLGLKFHLGKNNKWGIFCEAKITSASYGPKRGELVKYNIDGTDLLGSRTISDKKVIYKNKYVVDESIPPVSSEPAISSRRFYPFSSLGLNCGFFYTL